MKLFQHLDELKDSDGVGNDAIGLAQKFHNLGYECHFITRIPRSGKEIPNVKFHTLENLHVTSSESDVHILHYGGTGYPYDLFYKLFGKKILRFHNITPAMFYEHTTTPEIYAAMAKFESLSYLELASFSIFCDAIWCDSSFNYSVISDLNFKNPTILPICKKYQETKSQTKQHSIDEGNIIFIGRYSPQKAWEDLIEFFSVWVNDFPNAKLYCVGNIIGAFDGYFDFLRRKTIATGVENRVLFLQGKSDDEVLELLSKVSAFVSMSEHEGFCLPILEAFGMGIPVFAYSAGAIPQTMNGGGLLFNEKDYYRLKKDIKSILTNPKLKQSLIKSQSDALNFYNAFPWEIELAKNLEEIGR
ncbi:MAG: glycosyltransferase [Leptospira sp.]|nr:glycosyltransferase [Leptospira sp.]